MAITKRAMMRVLSQHLTNMRSAMKSKKRKLIQVNGKAVDIPPRKSQHSILLSAITRMI